MISDEMYNKLDGDPLLRQYEKVVLEMAEEIETYKQLVQAQNRLIKSYEIRLKGVTNER